MQRQAQPGLHGQPLRLATEDVFYDLLSYGGKGLAYGLTCWAWLCLLFYFITSSDSGSLVIDMIGANGEQDPPLVQRIFWAFTEGCRGHRAAQGLGRRPGRRCWALQAVSVVCGLPFTIMLMYMAHALYIAVPGGGRRPRRESDLDFGIAVCLGIIRRRTRWANGHGGRVLRPRSPRSFRSGRC